MASKGVKPKKRAYGYNEDIDTVVISHTGYIGEVVEISGLKIALPEAPIVRKIFGFKRKKENQKWERQPLPQGLSKETLKLPKFKEYIDSEYEKKQNGFFFYNNGNIEYITGAHWFMLQWIRTDAKTKGNYYHFTKAQQKIFWFLEACWADERCNGTVLEKIRRLGATYIALTFGIHRLTSYYDFKAGMTSKTDWDATNNMARIIRAFKYLPPHMQPLWRGTSVTKLDVSAPASMGRVSKNNPNPAPVDELGSEFTKDSTKESSYDGFGLNYYVGDEFSKWEKGNGCIINHLFQVRKAMGEGSVIKGMIFLLSTFEKVTGNDYDDSPKECDTGDKYKWIYQNSDPLNRNRNGQTTTGLYKLFISAIEHFMGHIDEYGYPVVETPDKPIKGLNGITIKIGIKDYLEGNLEAHKNNVKLQNDERRKNPTKEEDGWRVASDKNAFNTVKISDHISHNDKSIDDEYIKCNFAWEGGKRFGNAIVQPSANGRFKLYKTIPNGIRNAYSKSGTLKEPANKHIFVGGVDPYKTSSTNYGSGSMGSIHILSKTNGAGIEGNIFYLEYIERPQVKEIFWEDVMLSSTYFGCEMLIENNQDGGLLSEMYREGMTKYSMRRPDIPKSKLSYHERMLGGIPSSGGKLLQAHTMAIQSYVDEYIGIQSNGEYHPMVFNKTLNDWLRFDIKNREKHDASISSGLALFASQNHMFAKEISRSVSPSAVKSFYGIKK